MSPPHHPSLFFALLLIHHRFVLINRHLFHFVCEIGHLVPAFTSTAYKASDVALDERRLGLTDREIGERLDMLRATVQYQRQRALDDLRKILTEGLI